MNPPFDVENRVQVSPDAARRQAHVGNENTLASWIKTASGLLKPRGRLAMIHRADALGLVLDALKGRFGAIALVPVYSRDGEAATRILVTAIRDAKTLPAIRPGLVLHGADGGTTDEVTAILNGTVDLTSVCRRG
jgi:tRNA1(Val) A37 N6-methylase TrmN6